ncbi:transcriptional repressor [Secundilactobacillus paracollinoides]|uniref:Transcriptional repressor n=1 Tax=Secundilactobacillus paracollinoides TaxID=240427 RepID=A0A1B2IZ33_9LACO|nr:transcriptional repressor [Secundilactobacillus paracollinoides]ANZ61392.1 transcriptional repressor [Secundilactobacillus paracollinoides]ANZ64215.1 transcriptional repressor [Secundilactobacillus paracollinoides]ANZ67312.1 transcriptional repressor [Secundilactobacillus paracollinoides]
MQQTLTQAIDVLKKNHLKVTKQRKALLTYLLDNQDHYHDVTLVDDYMRQQFPGMSHNTIYRNIKEFEQAGMVEQQVEGDQARVKYQCDFSHLHHHHFICQRCGKVTELKECPLDVFQEQLPGYQIVGHRIELYGLCAQCRAEMAVD